MNTLNEPRFKVENQQDENEQIINNSLIMPISHSANIALLNYDSIVQYLWNKVQ